MTEKQFVNSYRTAGLWFTALYMEAFILRCDELEDPLLKTKLIEEIYDNGENAFDKEVRATRNRVNALRRIINANRIVDALEVAANSERLRNDFRDAYETANNFLKRIKNGDYIVPEI